MRWNSKAPPVLAERQIPPLIEDHEAGVHQAIGDATGFACLLFLFQLVDQLDSGQEANPEPVVLDGPFFFGAVETFEHALAGTHTDPELLIIRLRWVPFIDITGLQTLEEAIQGLQGRGVRVMLSGANSRVHTKLERAGIIGLVGETNYFAEFSQALAACVGAVEEPA